MRARTVMCTELHLYSHYLIEHFTVRCLFSLRADMRKQIITFFATNKQLLDEVFVKSRIIKVEVGVISQSRRLRLITLTETSIILDITKTESNNCFIISLH